MGLWKAIGRALGFGRAAEAPPYPASELGDGLGFAASLAGGAGNGAEGGTPEALRELERRLASACRATFMEQVRGRVMAARPELTDAAYDWALLELRRFFCLTAIGGRQVPMYSAEADAIWHEMLLFTREYESFCDSFAGRRIHHEPHTEPPGRSEAARRRLEFELIYGSLFRLYPMSERLLGRFGQQTFSAEQIEALGGADEAALRARFFADVPAGREAAAALARSVASGVEAASHRERRISDPRSANDYAAGMIAVSLIHGAAAGADERKRDDGGGGGAGGVVGDDDAAGGSDGGGDGGSSCGGGGCGGS